MGDFVEAIYGSLPPDWRMVRLKTLIEDGNAELQTGPFGTMLHASAYQTAGTPVIAVQHIGDNALRQGEYPLVDDENADRLKRYTVRENDILFARKGSVDRRARIRPHESGWLQGSDCIRLRFNRTLDARFISYVLGSSAYKKWIVRHAHGATMPSLNQDILGLTPLPLPPLPIQHRIADILGSLDDKIELNRKMNETLEAMARALFKSWFVDFDPVVAKSEGRQPVGMDAETAKLFPDSFEDSEIGRIPKGWKVGRFADVVQNRREVISAEQLSSGAYIGLEHMPRRSIALSDWGDSSVLESAKSRFRKNDILFGKLRPYFHKVGIAPTEGVCSTDILVLKPQTTDWAAFALGYASSDEMVDYADSCSTGTRMPRVNWSDLARYQIPIPPQSLAGRLTVLQEPVIESIFNNIQENRMLANLRDALLPRLLSGELAVATD